MGGEIGGRCRVQTGFWNGPVIKKIPASGGWFFFLSERFFSWRLPECVKRPPPGCGLSSMLTPEVLAGERRGNFSHFVVYGFFVRGGGFF